MKQPTKKITIPIVKFVAPEKKSKILAEENIDISKASCFVCGKKITLDNLGSIRIKKNGDIIFCCSDEKCMTKSRISLKDIVEQ